MKLSRWHRFGDWLERVPGARRLVLREDPRSAEYVLAAVDIIRIRAVNRINGHVVVIKRRPFENDRYLIVGWCAFLAGAIVQYGLGAWIDAAADQL